MPAANPLRWPLYLRVLLGAVAGGTLGVMLGQRPFLGGWTTADLGTIGALYIRLLTALATPLIFFAILDAFVRTTITGRQGLKLLGVCAVNIAAAFAIGLTILNVWQPGLAWRDLVSAGMRAAEAKAALGAGAVNAEPIAPAAAAGVAPAEEDEERSLSLLRLLDGYVPRSLVEPFLENTVLTVALLAIFLGTAMRSVKAAADEPGVVEALGRFEQVVAACFLIVVKMLAWLIELAPIAIFLVIAGLVGGTDDLGVLAGRVGVYFATVMLALGVHALLYYPLTAWLVGGVSPRRYFGEGGGAILTGFSLNSSLATAPVTLRALARLGVSDSSARLSACVGTNFNNDGITLYEAITALFVAQAAGMELGLSAQIAVLLAVLSGSMGIAGIPNSGLIILTLVLKAAQLPEGAVAVALPIIYSIDFINARFRSAVNVMGDLQVAILLDAGKPREPGGPA